jgi:hypothetical protein
MGGLWFFEDGIYQHTHDSGIVAEEEARGTDEEAEEVGSEGTEPCSWEVYHDGDGIVLYLTAMCVQYDVAEEGRPSFEALSCLLMCRKLELGCESQRRVRGRGQEQKSSFWVSALFT